MARSRSSLLAEVRSLLEVQDEAISHFARTRTRMRPGIDVKSNLGMRASRLENRDKSQDTREAGNTPSDFAPVRRVERPKAVGPAGALAMR